VQAWFVRSSGAPITTITNCRRALTSASVVTAAPGSWLIYPVHHQVVTKPPGGETAFIGNYHILKLVNPLI